MTKMDMINAVASIEGVASKKVAGEIINTLIDLAEQTIADEKKFTITGFGTFNVKKTKARVGRNPRTGESLKIKAHNVVRFSPGKELKDKVLKSK